MIPGALLSATSPPDWFGIGIVLAIVGGFLLANAILFRHPRNLVAEHFGRGTSRLSSIREYIFHRLQVHLGFLFLLVGFGLQLYGHYRPPAEAVGEAGFPTLWVGAILVGVVVLEIVGWWLSHLLFRRYVCEHFRAHPPDLTSDMRLARELGELFGIESAGDDSVQTYLARIRATLGVPQVDRSADLRPANDRAAVAEEAEELV